ncbi:MAG: hypothetical protein ACREJC_18745, partial [Tepidisphaeraceae bacterium]
LLRVVWILTDTADLTTTKLDWLQQWKWGEHAVEFLVARSDGTCRPIPRLWSRTTILDGELDEWAQLTRDALRALEEAEPGATVLSDAPTLAANLPPRRVTADALERFGRSGPDRQRPATLEETRLLARELRQWLDELRAQGLTVDLRAQCWRLMYAAGTMAGLIPLAERDEPTGRILHENLDAIHRVMKAEIYPLGARGVAAPTSACDRLAALIEQTDPRPAEPQRHAKQHHEQGVPSIPAPALRASQQYTQGVQQAGKALTDQEAYDYVKEHIADSPDELPDFEVWARHLREHRRLTGTQKNKPRGGRAAAARSVVSIQEIDRAVTDETG